LELGRAAHVLGGHETKLNVRHPLEGVVSSHVQFVRGGRLIALPVVALPSLDHVVRIVGSRSVATVQGNKERRNGAVLMAYNMDSCS
jgi:hypothetical protein